MKTPTIKEGFGAVAILDALGASSFRGDEIEQFLAARERVLADLNEWSEERHGSVEPSQLSVFTFADTVVVAAKFANNAPNLSAVTTFAAHIRKLLFESLKHGLLFRGSIAVGKFIADDVSNTVLGAAVADAAQWYEQSDWIGVHFTPKSFIAIRRLLIESGQDRRWAMIEFDAPLRSGKSLRTYCVNWPKVFLVRKLNGWNGDYDPKAKLLRMLEKHEVPIGTEQKYENALRFFDYSVEQEKNAAKISTKK